MTVSILSVLRITDGTNTINLLDRNRGFLLFDWRPEPPGIKGGGSWNASPLVPGRSLAWRQFDNLVDTFQIRLRRTTMDGTIEAMQELQRLLEKAAQYWIADWQTEPVWIEARGSTESEIRYAVIRDYRLNGMANPYSQPMFLADCNSVMHELNLTLEHGLWQAYPPGQGVCVQTSNQQNYIDIAGASSVDVSISGSAYDTTIDVLADTSSLTATTCALVNNIIDLDPPEYNILGLRFLNIAVPQGAIITRAYITLVAAATSSVTPGLVECEIIADGAFSFAGGFVGNTADDYYSIFSATPPPVTGPTWPIAEQWISGTAYNTVDLSEMIQHFVDEAAWVSGASDLTFYINPTDGMDKRTAATWDNVTHAAPLLHIEYATSEITFGQEPTCDSDVYIVNKHTHAQLTYMYYYDSGAAAYSANLIGAAKPTALLPANPVPNDIIYFGIDDVTGNGAPFTGLVFDLLGVMDNSSLISWEYPVAGPIWLEYFPTTGNKNLQTAGVTSVTWRTVNNWIPETINGKLAYWVRARVVASTSATVPSQQNREVYIPFAPYVDIDAAQIVGDISSLTKLVVRGRSGTQTATLTCGSRSLSRGTDFSAYLNISDVQQPSGLSLVTSYAGGTMGDDTLAPTGRSYSISLTAPVTMNTDIGLTMSPALATQYRGSFHVFVMLRQDGGTKGDARLRVAVNGWTSRSIYTRTMPTAVANLLHAVDLGVINIGSYSSYLPSEYPQQLEIFVELECPDTSTDLVIYEIVMIPVDEWAGTFADPPPVAGATMLNINSTVEIDSISIPRRSRAMVKSSSGGVITDYILGEWMYISPQEITLQANADQRIWFLFTYDTNLLVFFSETASVQVFCAPRYLVMRGSR